MRKLIYLCMLAMLAVSPLTLAQGSSTLETAIIEIVAANEGSAEDAYATLISPDNTTLTQAQKDALIALGEEAGTAFIDAINAGASLTQAAVAISAIEGVTSEEVNSLVAQLNTTSSSDGTSQVASNSSEDESQTEEVQTETAAGPGTAAGSGTPAAPGAGAGAPGAGAGGAGGGGTGGGVVSGN